MRQGAGSLDDGHEPAPLMFAPLRQPVYRWTAAAVAALLVIGVGVSFMASRLQTRPPADTIAFNPSPLPPKATPPTPAVVQVDPRKLVKLRVVVPDEHLIVPVQSKNPNVSIYWVYPTIKTAEAPRNSQQERSAS